MDLQERFGTAREVLDIAVTAVFRSAGDGARAFLADFLFHRARRGAGMYVLWLGGLSDDAVEGGGADEFGFAAVPFGEDFGAGCAAEDAGVDEAGEADAGDVPAGAEDAFKIPDGFGAVGLTVGLVGLSVEITRGEGVRFGIDFVKEASAVISVEDTGEAPWLLLKWLHVLDLDHEDVARLGIFHLEGSAQIVDLGQINVLHVICAVIVANLTTGPIHALDLDNFSVFDLFSEGYCRKG